MHFLIVAKLRKMCMAYSRERRSFYSSVYSHGKLPIVWFSSRDFLWSFALHIEPDSSTRTYQAQMFDLFAISADEVNGE
jgi:hypothetical protein